MASENLIDRTSSSCVEGIITQNFMSQENEIEAEKLSPTTDFLPSDGASCYASSDDLPTPHPSGAWDRSDYVRQYAKRVQELEEIRNVMTTLLEATDRYGMAGSMTHPRLTRAISAARNILPHNAKELAPPLRSSAETEIKS